MIPGSNILKTALSVIGQQTFLFYKFTGRSTNALGYDESSFASPVTLSGSVQAMSRSIYHEYGLDLEKNYILIYASFQAVDLDRDYSGDQVSWNGKRYQLISEADWYVVDGWNSVICVEIP